MGKLEAKVSIREGIAPTYALIEEQVKKKDYAD